MLIKCPVKIFVFVGTKNTLKSLVHLLQHPMNTLDLMTRFSHVVQMGTATHFGHRQLSKLQLLPITLGIPKNL